MLRFTHHYDPATGRYMSRDPFGEGLNLYTYVLNAPNTWIDPTGLFFCAFMGFAHGTLDMLGYIPILGIFPDLINGFLYLMEGDYWNLGLSLLSAVPLIGDLGGGLLKGLFKNSDNLAKGLFKHLDDVGDVGEKALGRNGDNARKVANNIGGCFVAGTLVLTREGLRPIEDIKTGDEVWARNEVTGELSLRKVVSVFVRFDREVLEIDFEDEDGFVETIIATTEHPFWVRYLRWIGASDLEKGDEVLTFNGRSVKVKNVRRLSESRTVHNFEVEGLHNYFVGEGCFWVHNASWDATKKGNYVDLTDARGRKHILDGDGPGRGGGHRPGTGKPGKSEFPANWSDEKILHEVSDIATDKNLNWSNPDSRGYISTLKTVYEVDVKVVFDTRNDRIVTAFPTNTPRNP